MKFQKLEAFERHCRESFPGHLSSIYFVVCSREEERKKILSSLAVLTSKECDFIHAQSIEEAIVHLRTPSLLCGKVAALMDCTRQLLKSEMVLLESYAKNPNPQGHLFLGSSSAAGISPIYTKGKKDVVFLDLSGEKPWEEKERIKGWALKVFAKEKKEIEPDALEALLERHPSDRQLLSQEIEKLVCYTGVRKGISCQDVEALCGSYGEQTPYQIAQALVWKKGEVPHTFSDPSILFPLVSQVRGQLEVGLSLSATTEDAAGRFPRLRPRALNACIEGTRTFGEGFFIEGLKELFALELALKTATTRPEILWNRFIAKLEMHR